MTKDGYPQTCELRKIAAWSHMGDYRDLMAHIRDRWQYADAGYWKQRGRTYWISTGGWSGNEDLIGALQNNRVFWIQSWYSTRRGGHYVFKLPVVRVKSKGAKAASEAKAGEVAMSEKMWDFQCPVCFLLVEDFADTDEQKCKWIYCERCELEREFVKLPGGHVDATAAASWRKDAP